MIYIIHPDYQRYKSFVFDGKAVRKALGEETQFHFSRAPISYIEGWQSFEISFKNLASKKAAMPDIMVRNGRLFLAAMAYEALAELIVKNGEFLPVTYNGNNGFLFNILSIAEKYDGIDKNLSTKNEFGEVQSLSFNESKISNLAIFRTQFDGYMGIYCSDEFYKIIERLQLKGRYLVWIQVVYFRQVRERSKFCVTLAKR
jgi:hypothetical protein